MNRAPATYWTLLVFFASSAALCAQAPQTVNPVPKELTSSQLVSISAMDGQLVEVAGLVRHADTAQVFTIGAKDGPEVHVIVPRPAIDAAHPGDTVTLTGFVRRFSGTDFERDYSWFRRADYRDVSGGDWVIVATSVRTTEGTELVPPGVISTSGAGGKVP